MKKNILLLALAGFLFSCGGSYDYTKIDKAYNGEDPADFIVLWDKYPPVKEGFIARVTGIRPYDELFTGKNKKEAGEVFAVTFQGQKSSSSAGDVPKKIMAKDKVCIGDVVHVTGKGDNMKVDKLTLHIAPKPKFDITANPNDFFAGVAFTDFEPDYKFYKGQTVGQIVDTKQDGDYFILTIEGKDEKGKPFKVEHKMPGNKIRLQGIYKWDVMKVFMASDGHVRDVQKMKDQKYVAKK
ncbi:MAG: hypothetical protein LBL47_04470 [Lactobacillus sp.]|jgi:hypothetical protein|nr:hypothetical protein [Lactobacillus sp.]